MLRHFPLVNAEHRARHALHLHPRNLLSQASLIDLWMPFEVAMPNAADLLYRDLHPQMMRKGSGFRRPSDGELRPEADESIPHWSMFYST